MYPYAIILSPNEGKQLQSCLKLFGMAGSGIEQATSRTMAVTLLLHHRSGTRTKYS